MDIKTFLTSDKFQALMSELKTRDIDILSLETEKPEVKIIMIELLKNHLIQRQYVLYGFNHNLQSEEETAEWLLSLLENDAENLKYICARVEFNKTCEITEEYPPGEEPDKDDGPDNIVELGYSETAFVDFIVELDMLKNHPKHLTEYCKRQRIPGAAKHAAEIKRLYKSIQM